jgi:hypothetical protein
VGDLGVDSRMIIEMVLEKKKECYWVRDWIQPVQERVLWRSLMNTVMKLQFPYAVCPKSHGGVSKYYIY